MLGALAGCSLDVRELQPRDMGGEAGIAEGEAGSGASGANSSAGGSAGGSSGRAGSSNAGAGRAGAGSAGAPLIGGCPDLDGNGVSDCDETLVKNPTFVSDVDLWLPELDATVTWDEKNATSDSPSGSALVRAEGVVESTIPGSALRDVGQCIAVDGQQLLTVYANAFVPAGQDEAGQAEVDVFFFDSSDCSGTLNASFVTPQPLDGSAGRWIELKAGAVSKDSTRSALVKLAVLKPFKAAAFEAHFDNVLVQTRTP